MFLLWIESTPSSSRESFTDMLKGTETILGICRESSREGPLSNIDIKTVQSLHWRGNNYGPVT